MSVTLSARPLDLAAEGLPRRGRGRPTPAAEEKYQEQVAAFCTLILKIRSSMDFSVGSRGWCYILEKHGLRKGQFDLAENLITACRKSGDLPLDICAEDDSRATIGLEDIDTNDVREEAQDWVDYLLYTAHKQYTPFSFWDDLDVYVEMGVEKLDLRNLFEPVCKELHTPLTNFKGWSDLNSRAKMMRRFAAHERAGRRCVLLLCGDHDPGGLHITSKMRKNMEDLSGSSSDLALTPISSIGTASPGSTISKHRAASNSMIPATTTTTRITSKTTSPNLAYGSARPTHWWLCPRSAASFVAAPSSNISQLPRQLSIGASLSACVSSYSKSSRNE
jgi:hypothetical protein